jgi:hypothetical protein
MHVRRTHPLALVPLAALALALGFLGLTRSIAQAQVVTSLVSTGSGSQQFKGGGLVYGRIRGKDSRLTVLDLSKKHDLQYRLSTPTGTTLKATPTVDGLQYLVPKGQVVTFRFSGSRYQLSLVSDTGKATLNGVGVFGKAWFTGAGSYSLDGAPDQVWNLGVVTLGPPGLPAAPADTVKAAGAGKGKAKPGSS